MNPLLLHSEICDQLRTLDIVYILGAERETAVDTSLVSIPLAKLPNVVHGNLPLFHEVVDLWLQSGNPINVSDIDVIQKMEEDSAWKDISLGSMVRTHTLTISNLLDLFP